MDKFLESYTLPRPNHEETENLNGVITTIEIETVIKTSLQNKSPGPDGITGEFYQTFEENLIHVLLKPYPKSWRGKNAS